MAEKPLDLNLESIATQLRQRLEGLGNAGIDWLPKAPPIQFTLPEESSMTESSQSLFEEPTNEEQTPEKRLIELNLLKDQVAACQRCPELCSTRTQTVFGVGPIGAEICFVGEAPGADEDRQGEPFVGTAGQMLNRIIEACGMQRKDIYICNILRCRPPGNRQPKPIEAKNCREYLEKTIELVGPKVICAWGATAAQNLLQTSKSIGKLRGQWHDYDGIPVLCTYHPASLLEGRSPENKKLVWDDMKTLLTKLGKPIPQGKKQG
jgi:uracil-DNA glycosylase